MAVCNHLAPNGAKSILYQDLEKEFGPDKAHDYWSAIYSDQFLYGTKDWLDDITDDLQEHLDENYEPIASWVKDKLGLTTPEFLKDDKEEVTEKVPTELPPVRDFTFINRNEELVNAQAAKDLIAKRDNDGNVVGYFSSAEQQEIINSTMNVAHQFLSKDLLLGSNAIIKTFKAYQAKSLQLPNSDFKYLYDQRVHIANELLNQLGNLGYSIDAKDRSKLLRAVDGLDYQKEATQVKLDDRKMEVDLNEVDKNSPELVEALGHGLSDWGEVSFEHDPKDTASGRIKMMIANLTDMDAGVYKSSNNGVKLDKPSSNIEKYYQENPNELRKIADKVNRKGFWMEDERTTNQLKTLLDRSYPTLPKRNFLGMNKLVDFEPTFQEILEVLADSPVHDFETYSTSLNATGRPNLQNLVKVLGDQDQQIRNEFARLVSTQYTQMMMLLFNRVSDGENYTYRLQPLISNRYSQLTTIVKNWQENQKLSEIMKINESGQRVIDVDRARNKWMPALKTLQNINWSKDGDLTKQSQAKKFIRDVLNVSGIHMTDEMMDDLFKRMESYTRGTNFAGGISKQFSITEDGKPAGMFSAFIMKMAGLSSGIDIDSSSDTKTDLESRAEMTNPLYTENAAMRILAKATAARTPVLHSGSSKNAEGKDIWSYTMHSKLSHMMIDLKDNFPEFASKYQEVDISKNNHLLKLLQERPAFRNKIQLIYMDGLKPTWGNKDRGTMRKGMSDREQLLMSMGLFQNQGERFNTGSHLLSLTHSDKTTTPLFMNMPVFDMGSYSIPRDIIGKIGSAFYNVFKGEYDRIIKQKDIPFNDSRYDKGKGLFYFMPEFNHESMKKMVEDGTITQREFESIWTGGEKELTKSITNDVELPVINKILTKIANDRIRNTFNTWKDNDLISESSNSFDEKYVRKLLDTYGIQAEDSNADPVSGRKTTSFYKDGKRLTSKEVNNVAIHGATKDYALNYFLHNVSLSQLFYGDPALTFKKGTTDMESVDLTMKEYGKRLAKDIAPGLDPYFRPQDKRFNSITLADHLQTEKYLDNLRNIFPSYKGINATDAQEFSTVAEHLIVKYANGEIPTKTFNEMMSIIKPGKYYEFTNPDHLQYIMQPQKPVFSGQRTPSNGAILEDYIKTSSIPLYPPATTGLEMDGLRQLMENRNISRAPFESGRKIGSPIKPAQFFSSDGTFTMSSEDEIKGATQSLDRSGFRIQQEVPYDEDKEQIKTVSQMNKLIVEGIDDMDGFKIGDQTYKGSQIREMKEQIRKDMLDIQYDQFLRDWGVNDDELIQDKSKVYDKLAQLATTKNFTINELQGLLGRDKNGNLWIPLQYNTGADKYESMLMSMVKDISQIKMPGKSFVQASSVGLKFKEGVPDNGKIVWTQGYDGSPLKTTRIEDGVVKSAQVLIPFNFIDTDGRIRDVKDFTKVVDGKKYIDSEKIPNELRQLIGARIPNQGHSSMAALEIVGFLPKEMGDTIIVPAGFTKQMGADFDVDKLYTYRRPYSHNLESDSFQVSNQEGMTKHQNDYFDVHHAVLTHPDMAEKILKPLDKDDLKNENKLLAPPKKDGQNFYDHINQLQDFQNGKDAKMLVALTSLAVTFNAVIQNKDLHYAKDEFEIGANGRPIKIQSRDFITVKDEHSGKILKLTNLSGNGKSNYTKEDGGDLSDSTIRSKSDNQSTIQSAAVDNAKDRALDNLNITPFTYPAARALMDLETEDGLAVNLKYATRLLTQPIIKEYNNEMKKGNDSLSETYDPNLRGTVIANLLKKYQGDFGFKDYKDENNQLNIVFDPQLMKKAQGMKPDSEEYAAHQIAALQLFAKLEALGKRESEIQSYFNQDTQGAGPNLLTALDKADKMDRLNMSPVANGESITHWKGKSTEAGYTADVTTGAANRFLTQLLPYDKYVPLFRELTAHSGKSNMSIDTQRGVLRAVRSFVYNSGQHWWADAPRERERLFYTKGESSLSLARRIELAKRTWGKDNYFLQRLDPSIGNTEQSPDYISYQASSVETIDEQNNNRAWLEMLMSKDETQRKLGEDLLRYAYLTGGVQDANSFVKYVPNAYISNTDFGNMLKMKGESYMEESNEDNTPTLDMPGFIPQYIQHNPKQAFVVRREAFGDLSEKQNYPESFKADVSNKQQSNLYNDQGEAREWISYRSPTENKWILYHYNPQGGDWYTRVDTLGNDFTDEYDGENSSMARSSFKENQSLASQLPPMSEHAQYARQVKATLGDFYDKVTPHEQLNIHEGVGFQLPLKTIADDEEIPQYLRSVAEMYSKKDISEAEYNAKRLLGGDYNPRIEFDKDMSQAGLAFPDGRIKLNPQTTNKQSAAETFIHEITHQRVLASIMLAGYDNHFDNLEGDKKIAFQKIQDQFAKDHPEVIQHIRELDRIRLEAFTKLKSEMGEDAIREAERKINNKETLNQQEALLYGSQSLQEFVPHVMSDKFTQDYLSKIPSSSGTFLQRIWGKIVDLIRSITGRKESSLLDEALYHSIALTGGPEEYGDFTRSIIEGGSMRTRTEQHAKDIQRLGEDVYNRNTDIKTDPLGHDVSFGALKKAAVNPGIPLITEKLRRQMEDAYKDVSKGTEDEQIQARIRYNELKFDYHDVVREHNPAVIANVAHHQLEWAETILRNSVNNAATTHAALEAVNLWSNLIDNMYGTSEANSIDDSFRGIQEDASLLRNKLVNRKARAITISSLSNIVTLVPQDLKQDLTEPNIAEGNLLTLARLKPKLLSGIGALTKQSVDNQDEEINRVNDRLRGLAKDFKRLGIKPSMFMQKDTWGLRDRLSNKWFEHLSDLNRVKEDKLNTAYRAEGLTTQQRDELKQRAYQEYFDSINRSAAIVDTRAFFDFKTGDHKNDQGYRDAFNKLAEKVGSEDYAKELVDQAHEKYQDYIHERQIMVDHIQSETQLTDDEKKGLNADQQEDIRNKKMETQLNKWLLTDSPDHFLNKLNGKGDLKYLNNGDRFLVFAPKHDQTSFYDTTYNEVDQNPEIGKVFREYKALIQEMTSYLPPEHSEKLPPGFLPIVSPQTVNSLASMLGKLRNWDSTIMETLMSTERDEWTRLKPDEIPILYTRDKGPDQEKSDDLINVAKVFSMMALHYKHMAPILDQVNVMESLVKEAQRQRVNGSDEGPTLDRALKILQYNKDRLIFQKPNPLEGKLDFKFHTLKPMEGIKIQKEVKKLNEEKTDLQNKIREKEDQGVFDVDKEQDRIEQIDKKLTEHENSAKYIYASKVGDTLISVNQLKAVAYNPFSVVPVFCFNGISMMNFAQGRMEYDPTHLWQARGITMHATKNYYTLGKGNDETAQKIRALMERSGVMTSLSNLEKNVDFNRSRVGEALSPYNWHQAGDYYNKSTMMVAMMLKKQVEVEDAQTGEKSKIHLWDTLDKNGKWDTSKYKENKEWYSDNIADQKEWNKFRDKMRGVANIVFGNQDKNSPILVKKSVLGRLVGQFRISWFPEGLNTRFGSERYDPLLQRDVKGRYRSFATLGIASSFVVMARSVLDMLPGITIDRFKGLTDKNGEQITDLDKENMRRNFAGMAWIVGITASILLLKSAINAQQGKKRDEKDMILQAITNSLIRNQQDLTMYASPGVWDTVTGNIIPATNVITDAVKAMKATGHYLFGDTHKDKHAFETWMLHLTKATPILNNINKAKYMTTRNLDDIQR